MAWTVRVQNERGQPAGSGDFGIPFEAIPDGPDYPICSSVARYYVTLLNPPQLETFVREWDRAAKTEQFEKLRDQRVIRDVAERCAGDQLYLRFEGD